MDITYALLRVLHIGSGALWVGAAVVVAVYVEPTARHTGPEGQRYMQALMRTSFRPAMIVLGVVTILAGLALYWQDSGGFTSAEWLRTSAARTFGIGGIFGIASLLLGIAFTAPAAARLTKLASSVQAAGRPPTAGEGAQLGALSDRLTMLSRLNAALLVLALLLMAVARAI
jgi:hypothetical protein